MPSKYRSLGFFSLLGFLWGWEPIGGPYGFIENKGQIVDQDMRPNPRVLYLLPREGLNVQLWREGFAYDGWQVVERGRGRPPRIGWKGCPEWEGRCWEERPWVLRYHRVEIYFEGRDGGMEIVPLMVAPDYLNWFTWVTGACGVTHVRHYGKVLYKNVWPGVHIWFEAGAEGMKWTVEVEGWAEIERIKWRVVGGDGVCVDGKRMEIGMLGSRLREEIPGAWYEDGQPAEVYFCERGEGVYGFQVEGRRPLRLFIDPTPQRDWGTYYGSSAQETYAGFVYEYFNARVAVSQAGEAYLAGTSWGNGLGTPGTHQPTLAGGIDNILAKFDVAGNRVWSTYYGGSNYEAADLGVALLGDTMVYIMDGTNSPTNIATAGAYRTTPIGWWDVYVAKLRADNGQRVWGTYYGGSSIEYSEEVGVSSAGVYIAGQTASGDLPVVNAHQPSLGGSRDLYIAKLSHAGDALIFSTYYGGNGWEDWFSGAVAVTATDEVYVAGYTESSDNISTMNVYNGSGDGFLVKLKGNGVRQWGRYVGGSSYDYATDVAIGDNGEVYVVGVTQSVGLATPGVHQTALGGGQDAFVMRVDGATGATQWFTYYGGSSDELQFTSVSYEGGYVFVAGATSSGNGISTSGAYQVSLGGGVDGWLAKINAANGQRVWGTYYGGGGTDALYAVDVLQSGSRFHIWVSGATNSTGGIASAGAFQSAYGGGNDDLFLVKLCDPDCAPLAYQVRDEGHVEGVEEGWWVWGVGGELRARSEGGVVLEVWDGLGRWLGRWTVEGEVVLLRGLSGGVYYVRDEVGEKVERVLVVP